MITVDAVATKTDIQQVREINLNRSDPEALDVARAIVKSMYGDMDVQDVLEISEENGVYVSAETGATLQDSRFSIKRIEETISEQGIEDARNLYYFVMGIGEVSKEEAEMAQHRLRLRKSEMPIGVCVRENDFE